MYRSITLFIFLVLFLIKTGPVYAYEKTVTGSAVLVLTPKKGDYDDRAIKLKIFFDKYRSPLSEYSDEFIYWADFYGLDYRLVPAITGVESTFGKRMPKGSFNAYGWNSGDYKFTSWEESIRKVSKTLKEKYYDKGAKSIKDISMRYAPPSRTWAKNVIFFMEKIDPSPVTYEY